MIRFYVFVVAAFAFVVSCGQVKAVEGGVHLDTSNCTEVRPSVEQKQERAVLDCISGGDVRIRIELQRSVWNFVQTGDAGTPAAAAAGAPVVAVLGSRCREDLRDDGASYDALLQCEGEINGQATYFTVSLGRQEWRAVKSRTRSGPFEPGPGK